MSASARRCSAIGALLVTGALAACSTTESPTFIEARIDLRHCPGRGSAGRLVKLGFEVENRGEEEWPATYVLVQGLAHAEVSAPHHASKGIGGDLTRVSATVAPEKRLEGNITGSVKPGAKEITVGVWGAPANSVAVPERYAAPACRVG